MGKAPDDDVSGQTLSAVETEVDDLRQRTQALVEELERRIRDRVGQARDTVERVKHAVDLPAQARRHPAAALGVGAGAAVALGAGAWLLVRSRRRANLPSAIVRRRAAALRQLLIDPEHARANRERLGQKVLGAALATLATVLVRALAVRATHRLIEAPAPAPRV